MKNFRHFLITRFNIRYDWTQTRSGEPVLTQEWLKQRFQLFETWCLPSVKNQSNQDFIWMVLLNNDTPPEFKERMEKLASAYSNLNPVYIAGRPQLKTELMHSIKGRLLPTDKFVISTRLDNDDMLHKDFIGHIQKLFIPVGGTVIDLRLGYQLTLNKGKYGLRERRKNFNPFISLIEDRDQIRSVHDRQHKEWKQAQNLITDESKRLWIELIHTSNMINETDEISMKTRQFDSREFGLEKGKIPLENPLSVFVFNLRLRVKNLLYPQARVSGKR